MKKRRRSRFTLHTHFLCVIIFSRSYNQSGKLILNQFLLNFKIAHGNYFAVTKYGLGRVGPSCVTHPSNKIYFSFLFGFWFLYLYLGMDTLKLVWLNEMLSLKDKMTTIVLFYEVQYGDEAMMKGNIRSWGSWKHNFCAVKLKWIVEENQ